MPVTLNIGDLSVSVPAQPLAQDAFAPFGDVIANPRPQLHPAAFAAQQQTQQQDATEIPHNPVPANQGSAIKYQDVSRMQNLLDQAPSGRPGAAVMSVFACAARGAPGGATAFPVRVLERHPFTSQTFLPLTARPDARYLVVVAPSRPAAPADEGLPGPREGAGLPGRGMPDVGRLRAFVARADQAVTYGAGTWHAPMVALGDAGTAVDFAVVQFANGVGLEDCQEVVLESSPSSSSAAAGLSSSSTLRGIGVLIPGEGSVAKL